MNINGEYVWIPHRKCDLIAGLKRMGITRVNGVPVRQMPKRQLTRAYCRERAGLARRRQREVRPRIQQLELFPIAE